MTVTPATFRSKLAQHLGYAYRVGPSRCTGQYGYHDCSGYMCWAMNQTGLTNNLCTSSFAISIWCYDLGLRIGENEARHTNGVFAVRGADFGRRSGGAVNGSDGHIVACYLPSTGGTYEAMGRRYGVVNGSFENRGWSAFYKIPGMHYGPPPPPPPPPEPTWRIPLIWLPHPEGKGTWIAVTGSPGRVVFLTVNGAELEQGMDVDPADRAAFGNRHIDHLEHRTRNDGKPGFKIRTVEPTPGYVPKSQI